MKKLSMLAAAGALLIGGAVFVSCSGDDSSGGSEATLNSITAKTDDVQTVFSVGDEFTSDGLTVRAVYSTGAKTITEGFTAELASANLDSDGKIIRSTEDGHTETAAVTVTYENQTTTYDVTISDVVSSIALTIGDTAVSTYEIGADLALTGITVTAYYSEDDTEGEDVTDNATFAATYVPADSTEAVEFTTDVEAGTYNVTLTATYAGKTDSEEVSITVTDPDDDTPADTGSAAELASYVYHKSLLSGLADSWGSGTGVTVADGKATMVSGNLWGAGGVCGVSAVELGEIADYAYIVFTVDASSYTVSEAKEDLSSNTGVNVKIPEVIARPAKWYTVNGKTTYYIATSEFSSASTATAIALIIGGDGTLVVEEFYLAATEEPAEKEITYANATIYTAGTTGLTTTAWYGTWDFNIVDDNIVSTGAANGCFGIGGFTAVPFKANAKLEVTYKATQAWAVKPVQPEVETAMEASDDFTTVTVDLGSTASNLTAVGIVHKADDSTITISSIKVIDNE
ncbi:hypothetical protein [Treponema sp.]|uniref:hypothetical protein n=1 Tax=Treponema sp. TaxID=166 RepID=UPI0025D56D21|nr:hypothetical protein [Treponema sp.]MCR5218614.1 hypothetical protein [Treponema sp.]